MLIGFVGGNLGSWVLAGVLSLRSQGHCFGAWDFAGLWALFQFYSFLHYIQRKRPHLYLTFIILFDAFVLLPMNALATSYDRDSLRSSWRLQLKVAGLVGFLLGSLALTS